MRSALKHLAIVALIYASAILGGMLAYAQQPAPLHARFAPVVGNQAQPSASLTKLVDQDCGFVEAWPMSDGRILVAFQTRPDGKVYLTEDKGPHLAKIDIPPIQSPPQPPQPQDANLPGPKQGSVSIFELNGTIYMYFTGRAEGDLSGPFYVWRLTMPVPAVGT